ncbi:MAG: class II D-tagatose-bisphosphate aldolase, non-catalytic subunit, partial [Rhodothermia bacterium]|nr:class II D-tagatose-bisphosphate aldolase, non-catalytic subunit [Rhodothermia bacterium]
MSDSNSPTSGADTVSRLLQLRRDKTNPAHFTLLAVCPISPAIVDANLLAAAESDAPAIFTATLNQVDTDGGYSGWTPETFAHHVQSRVSRIAPGLNPVLCLDHGGPWKKDAHRARSVPFDETWSALRDTVTSCLEAGYEWLHFDSTVDLDSAGLPSPALMAERTEALIALAEEKCGNLDGRRIHYEVGVEETSSGEDSAKRLKSMLANLRLRLSNRGLPFPAFAVCDVGTQLDRASFVTDRATAAVRVADHFGAVIKAH